jgi:hypothetical protein
LLDPKTQKCKTVKDVAKILAHMVPWQYHFGNGLYLVIDDGAASWKHRYQKGGKPHWVSLRVADVSDLKQARDNQLVIRQEIHHGSDPALERAAAKRAAKEAAKNHKTFRQCAEGWEDPDTGKHVAGYLDGRKIEWKDRKAGTYDAWVSSLKNYVYPKIGDMDVSDIDRQHIKDIVSQPSIVAGKPLWDINQGHFIRNRVELIIDFAVANRYRRYREGFDENPAKRTIVDAVMARKAMRETKNLASLPYKDLPGFMKKLRDDGGGHGAPAMAGEFLILTQVRVEEVCGAKWSEIHLDPAKDKDAPVWKIPGPRMKGRKTHKQHDHWVPLSPQAVELLNSLPREKDNPWLFISVKKGSERVSKYTVSDLAKRLGYDGNKLPKCTMHGFRATMGEWGYLPEQDYNSDVLNFCWAHRVGDQTDQAYLRKTKFEQRRKIMNKWGAEITAGLRPLRTEAIRQAEAEERRRIASKECHVRHREKDNAVVAKWHAEHREEQAKKKKDAYAANPEPMKAYLAGYRAEPEHREAARAYGRGYTAGLRKGLDRPRQQDRHHADADARTPAYEKAYQQGYLAGKARAKKGGVKGYRPGTGPRGGATQIIEHQ